MRKEGSFGTSYRIKAPGKINLHLRVKDRRPDGFHELESIFLALAWGDTLRFSLDGEDGLCDILTEDTEQRGIAPLPLEKNLVYRAVSLFRSYTGFSSGVRIVLEKRIPLGSGLGGGSSDAASTLLALDALAGTELSGETLTEMACRLGSDVPFFLNAGAAWVYGRGDRMRPLKVPELAAVVLVYPGFPSGTAESFCLLDQARNLLPGGEKGLLGEIPGLKAPSRFPGAPLSEETLTAALGKDPREWPYGNDFLPVFLALAARETGDAYRGMLKDLATLGAVFSGLSGAGSSCFGIFQDEGVAREAVKILSRQWNYVQLTFPLARRGQAVLQ
jgi:4-diphosphocytidyl-2-C-methyl-D-erythritol kinase